MALRSYAEQVRSEQDAEAAFRARLGSAAPHFDRATPEQVRDAIACPKHGGKLLGQWCGWVGLKFRRPTGYVCIDRRVAAALQAAEAR